MNAPVKTIHYNHTTEYIKELIDIVRPKALIAMGAAAYNTLRIISGNKFKPSSLTSLVSDKTIKLNGTPIYVVYHCSRNGQRTQPFADQLRDWKKLRGLLSFLKN